MDGRNFLMNAASLAGSSNDRADHRVRGLVMQGTPDEARNRQRIIRIIARVYSASCQRFILVNPDDCHMVIEELYHDDNLLNIVRRGSQILVQDRHTLMEALKWSAAYVAYGQKLTISPCLIADDKTPVGFYTGTSPSKMPWNSFINHYDGYFSPTVIESGCIATVSDNIWNVTMKED